MKSVIFLAFSTLFLLEVSIVPVYLVPIWDGNIVTSMAEYPYMCGLYKNLTHVPCGCAIISPNFALTAAHCFEEGDPDSPLTFFAGSVKFQEGETRQIFQKTDVTIHQEYNTSGNVMELLTHFNLAIIKLNPPLNFTDNIKSIRLAGDDDCRSGAARDYIITGWANNTFSWPHDPSDTDVNHVENLLWGIARPLDNKIRCEGVFGVQGYDDDKHICTSRPAGACVGDYGGPLVHRKSNGSVLCGVIGSGILECYLKHSIYSRVSYNKKWICEDTYNEPAGC